MSEFKSIRLEHKLRRFFSLSPYDYYQYLNHELFKALSKSFFKKYLKNTEIKKLQIGCGYNLFEGWLNTDLTYKKGKIGFLDASKTFPFENNSFDYIYSEHIFEHLNFKQELNMLTECFRILKPNGVIRLATPNMQFLFDLYLNPKEEINKEYIDWSLKHFLPKIKTALENTEGLEIYVINNFFRDWDHQIIHTEKSLCELFKTSGYKNIHRCETGKSKLPSLQNLEQHENIVGEKFNKLETLIIEAQK